MIRLTIVIPAVSDQRSLDDTLLSVLENRPAHSEILVVHRPGYHDPYDLGDEVRFVAVPAAQDKRAGAANANLVELLQAGYEAAQGEWLHWLLPGVTATAGWTEWLDQVPDPDLPAAVAPLLMTNAEDHGRLSTRLHSLGVNYRVGGKRYFPGRGKPEAKFAKRWPRILGPSLWAGFVRRSTMDELGGWETRFGSEWADVDLAVRLHQLAQACEIIPTSKLKILSRAVQDQVEPPAGFQSACRAARFYRQQESVWRSTLSRSWTVMATMLTCLPSPTALSVLGGALWGAWTSGRKVPVRVAPLTNELPTSPPAAGFGEGRRLDAGHSGELKRPHVRLRSGRPLPVDP